jgi:hypothetical protein
MYDFNTNEYNRTWSEYEEIHYQVENNQVCLPLSNDPRFTQFIEEPTPLHPMNAQAVEAYCKGGGYASNRAKDAPLFAKTDSTNQLPIRPKCNNRPENGLGLSASPNPFSNEFSLSFSLDNSTNVSISIANVLGQQVKVIEEGQKDKGNYNLSIDAKDLVAGTYFVTVKTTEGAQTLKIIKQ